jgi:hypothetical protein
VIPTALVLVPTNALIQRYCLARSQNDSAFQRDVQSLGTGYFEVTQLINSSALRGVGYR